MRRWDVRPDCRPCHLWSSTTIRWGGEWKAAPRISDSVQMALQRFRIQAVPVTRRWMGG